MKNLQAIYEAGAVRRFHTKRVIQETTVAHHTWGVMLVLLEICDPSPNLLKAALFHDAAEVAMGDIPAPAKWNNSDLAAAIERIEADFDRHYEINYVLTGREWELLKWADSLELMLYARTEMMLGNRYLGFTLQAVADFLGKRSAPSPRAASLLEELRYDPTCE